MTVIECPRCGENSMHCFPQFKRTYGTCEHLSCCVVGITLELGAHECLTDAELAAYAPQVEAYRTSHTPSDTYIDMRSLWRGETPDAETVRQIQAIFGTTANKRLIAEVALQAAHHEEVIPA